MIVRENKELLTIKQTTIYDRTIMLRSILFLVLLCLLVCFACVKTANKADAVFQLMSPQDTGVDFVNVIEETDSFNMYTFMNIYTGGGVAVGDINKDGLEDLFFSGNRVSSRLYLNKGNLKFEDITKSAGVQTDRWCTGVAMVDINQDDWLDIYVSVSGVGIDEKKSNLLFINQGDQTFKESSAPYGLADPGQIMQSSFFDYDRDGDLDVYCILNPVDYTMSSVNKVKKRSLNGESKSTDRLYRNNGDQTFTEVSKEAGILVEGYSLGLATADINKDGWVDIYVSNDFLTNDILYINNQDGTFSNQASSHLDHTSFAGMGNDIADFNNDAWPDIIVVDMLPEDNYRRKMIIPKTSYDKFQLTLKMGYEAQYTRNTLQRNNGDGTFSEVGQMAGLDQTDWSWSSLFADFDNDGDKDLYVTNGFLRDVGNLDYINYQRKNSTPFGKKSEQFKKRLEAIKALGAVKIENYAFENMGGIRFEKKNIDWGFGQKSSSNGAAFADLDNDGDLEMIVNNVNDPAFIYKNRSDQLEDKNYLQIALKGALKNKQGIGAKVRIKTGEVEQYYEHNLYRGYESTVSQIIHFGLGSNQAIERLEITWPDGKIEKQENLSANQRITLNYKQAKNPEKEIASNSEPFFSTNTAKHHLNFKHKENDQVDFKIQALLPHQHAQNGPGIAVGDVNGDGLDDCYIGGASGYRGTLFIQEKGGQFTSKTLPHHETEDMAALFFDADKDGAQDLFIVSGGSKFPMDSPKYKNVVYRNNGQGDFTSNGVFFPDLFESGSCMSAADFDKDGDLDLFIGGRVKPGAYPLAAKSYILRNDSEKGVLLFTEQNRTFFPEGAPTGMVCASLWTDFNNDGWQDLIVTGEWMDIQFYENKKGLLYRSKNTGLTNAHGWWNSITAGDFDADGDMDYVLGNLGHNSRYKPSPEEPLSLYAADFDKNGRIDPILCHYIDGENYIAHPRTQLIDQINAMRVRFKTYHEYAETTFDRSFTKDEIQKAQVFTAETFSSSYLENLGNGKFAIKALPQEAQIAPVYGMITEDFDGDGHLDILLAGNSFATEVTIGRYDAGKGLLLKGNGKGDFQSIRAKESGFLSNGDAKALTRLMLEKEPLYLLSNNADSLKVFSKNKKHSKAIVRLEALDESAQLTFLDGHTQKVEFYYGEGYLSQTSRQLLLSDQVISIDILNSSSERRIINLQSDKIIQLLNQN